MPNGGTFLEKYNQSMVLCKTKAPDVVPSFVQEIEMLSEEDKGLVRIGKVLGSGGFGCVYEGLYKGKQVAIKKFHVNSKSRRAMLQSFEAETVLSFCHPNIIKTLGAFGKELQLGCRFIVMEFAGNKTLRNIIDNDKDVINQARRLKFGLQMASALEFLHKIEIAHLDVKPANIIVDKHDMCKLGDFGCSQVVGEGSDENLPASPTCSYLTGTFAYRAPELLKGEAPTTQADMYSMGICLWQLLTREQPYGSENLYVVVFGVVAYNLRPPVPPAGNPSSRQYDALVERLWQSDPSSRPSATQAIETLRMLQIQ